MTVAAEFECSLQSIFVSLACVASDEFEVFYYYYYFLLLFFFYVLVRACLRGGGGPQVGEITPLGGATRLSI